jgi:peptide/nickel transport system permease protein
MNPLTFFLRRLVTALVTLFGVTLITFTLTHLISSNPLVAWLGKSASIDPQLAQIYIKIYHLKSPLYLQYFYYIDGLLHADWGFSFSKGEPVAQAVSQTLPYTIQLVILSLLFTIILGVAGGILSARFHGSILDKTIRTLYILGYASPAFFIALVLILVFSLFLPVLPTGGAAPVGVTLPKPITHIPLLDALIEGDWTAFSSLLRHAILPSLALSLGLFGVVTRVLRSSILELINSNFIRAARARGVSENKVYFYAFKNSLVAVITLLAITVNFTLVADIFVENIFAYPGVGQYVVQAALSLDYPAVLAITLVYAIIIVTANFIADLLYAVVDPRIRYE